MLHAVTEGDQGYFERHNRVEYIQYNKIRVKMLCDTVRIVNSSAI
jgi:hypothetical protein